MELKLLKHNNVNALNDLRLKPEFILRAFRVLEREFGSKWLLSLSDERKTSKLISGHPIVQGLLGEFVSMKTLEVVELATYVEYIKNVVKDGDAAITRLKGELRDERKFYDYLTQLMVTARFGLFASDLSVETMIEGQTPDIVFQLQGTQCIVEVTRVDKSQISTSLERFFGQTFEWLEKKHPNGRLDLLVTVKTPDLHKHEKELQAAIKRILDGLTTTISTDMFDVEQYEFKGTVDDFMSTYRSLAESGVGQAFVTYRANSIPSIPPGPINFPPRITMVFDFSNHQDVIYGNLSERVETAIRNKVRGLESLQNGKRAIYIYVNIGETAQFRPLELDRLVGRVIEGKFVKYPGLLAGVSLFERLWNQPSRRFHLAGIMIHPRQEYSALSEFIVNNQKRVEENTEFIGELAGW